MPSPTPQTDGDDVDNNQETEEQIPSSHHHPHHHHFAANCNNFSLKRCCYQHPKILVLCLSSLALLLTILALIIYFVFIREYEFGIYLLGQCTYPPSEITSQAENLAEGGEHFSRRFYRVAIEVESKEKYFYELEGTKGSNFIVSPLSAAAVLSLAFLGAEDETRERIRETLGLPCTDEDVYRGYKSLMDRVSNTSINPNFTLSMANRIFLDSKFEILDSFRIQSREFFDAQAENADFRRYPESARERINEWVKLKTRGKIPELMESGSIGPEDRMILINAVYFLGTWRNQFDLLLTERDDFFGSKSTEFVSMMQTEHFFAYYEDLHYAIKAKALRIPYRGNEVALYVILPNSDSDLNHVEANLGRLNFLELIRDYKSGVAGERRVLLRLPKFQLEAKTELNRIFEALGAAEIFHPELADFGGISTADQLYVGEIVQKAYVEVDEVGTEAAASTGVTFRTTSSDVVEFICNRPFMFFIADEKIEAILFVGRFVQSDL